MARSPEPPSRQPSTGRNKALEVRDGDPERFGGAGVLRVHIPPRHK